MQSQRVRHNWATEHRAQRENIRAKDWVSNGPEHPQEQYRKPKSNEEESDFPSGPAVDSAPKEGGPGPILDQGTRSCMLQLSPAHTTLASRLDVPRPPALPTS